MEAGGLGLFDWFPSWRLASSAARRKRKDRATEGAEQSSGGRRLAVTELWLSCGEANHLAISAGRRSRLSGCSLPVGLRRHRSPRSFQLRRAFLKFGDHPYYCFDSLTDLVAVEFDSLIEIGR